LSGPQRVARCAGPRHGHSRVNVATKAVVSGSSDVTASVLGGAIDWALKSRLTSYGSIKVNVQSSAFDLMGGKFGGMVVTGTKWRTPLMLTAETIDLSVGDMLIDYPKLLMQAKVQLKNIPTGTVKFVLSPTDLGNLMVHELMKLPSSRAVLGKPFFFDKGSVVLGESPTTRETYVQFEGVAAADGQRYRVVMTPCNQRRLRVSARRVEMDSSMDEDDIPSSSSPSPPGSIPGYGTPSLAASGIDTTQGPGAVAAGMTQLFTGLVINLSGVEISKPQLSLFRAPAAPGSARPGQPPPQMLLQIAMSVRILELPPLNMKF